MYVLEGEVTLESDGFSETYRAGDTHFVPKGFTGFWRQTQPMVKYHVIIENRSMDAKTFDSVITSAGSAGCVLARRLSEAPGVGALVLEAGGSDRSVIVSMPAALTMPTDTRRFNWGMTTEPEPGLGGRRINLPRGKGMGGSSSINGMCFVRGNPMDCER